jgi:hypothetical protein
MAQEKGGVKLSFLEAKWPHFSALTAGLDIESIFNVLTRRTAMTLVFQYGSNCSESEINSGERLRGDAKFVDITETVEDFEIAFDVQSRQARLRGLKHR